MFNILCARGKERYQEVRAALLESVVKNRPKRPPFY